MAYPLQQFIFVVIDNPVQPFILVTLSLIYLCHAGTCTNQLIILFDFVWRAILPADTLNLGTQRI